MKPICFALLIVCFLTATVHAQERGIYALTNLDPRSINTAILTNPSVDGVAARYTWDAIEPREGVYRWGLIDNLVTLTHQHGKHLAFGVQAGVRTPEWVYAAGVPSFSFVWDRFWGPPLCSVQTIPIPWDPIYVAKWTAFEKALVARYSGNPTVVQLKLEGLNAWTDELSLPHRLRPTPIVGANCASFDDTANWVAAGYTRTKVLEAWLKIVQPIESYPAFAAMLVPSGFPPIDDAGKLIRGVTADSVFSSEVLATGFATWPLQFAGQNNGLNDIVVWAPRVSAAAQGLTTGDQMVGPLPGSALRTAIDLALAADAQYLEIYSSDLLDRNQQSTLAYAHSLLVGGSRTALTQR
jgi:hypothetical protein